MTPPPEFSRDYRDVVACLGWLSGQAGRPLSPERLIATLTDGRDTVGDFDLEGLASALRQAGLALEPIPAPRGPLTEAQVPAMALADNRGSRVVGFTTAPDGTLEARLFSAATPNGVTVDPKAPAVVAAVRSGRLYRLSALPAPPTVEDYVRRKRHWFWGGFGREAGTYAYVAVAAAVVNVIALVSSLYTMAVYDRVIPNNSLVTLWTLTAGVALVYAFDFVFRTLRGLLVDSAARRMDVLVSRDLFEHLLGLRLESRQGSTGTTANMMREFGSVQDFFSSATLLAVVDVPFVVLFLAVIYAVAPACFWPVAAAVPAVIVAGLAIQARLSRLSQDAYMDGQEKHGALVETLAGLEAVRGLGAERAIRRRWRDRVAASAISSSEVRFYQQLAVNVSLTIQQLATLAVVVVGVLAIQEGKLSQGALIAAVLLAGRALAPLSQFAQILSRANLTGVSMKALDRFFAAPTERPEGRVFLDRPRLQGGFELRGTGFAYPGKTPVPVLEGLNLAIRPGEKVAILGRVGSGKSTLLKLLIGLYQPTSGSVLIDGVDLRQVDPAQLRAQVAYVPQMPVLFSGTVRENIAIARPEATDAEVLRAASVAGVDGFIKRHPLGYDMPLGERGEGLSIGQRQGIAIAQALVKNADVLLMDEPSSAMDDRTEEEFRRQLKPLLTGKTLVVVTHKASMLDLVDRVILVEGGRVIVDGTKDAVLKALTSGEVKVSAP